MNLGCLAVYPKHCKPTVIQQDIQILRKSDIKIQTLTILIQTGGY